MGFWQSTKKPEEDKSEGETSMADTTTIDFGEILDISFAAKFHSQLKGEVPANSTVQFVTTDLSRIDASCLQVLASYMRYAKEKEINIEWVDPGEIMLDASRLTGLTEVLELN